MARPGRASLPKEAFVVAQHQLALDLLHRFEPDTDDDEHGGAAEREPVGSAGDAEQQVCRDGLRDGAICVSRRDPGSRRRVRCCWRRRPRCFLSIDPCRHHGSCCCRALVHRSATALLQGVVRGATTYRDELRSVVSAHVLPCFEREASDGMDVDVGQLSTRCGGVVSVAKQPCPSRSARIRFRTGRAGLRFVTWPLTET